QSPRLPAHAGRLADDAWVSPSPDRVALRLLSGSIPRRADDETQHERDGSRDPDVERTVSRARWIAGERLPGATLHHEPSHQRHRPRAGWLPGRHLRAHTATTTRVRNAAAPCPGRVPELPDRADQRDGDP